jgi:carboxymethylenebutenolidase
VQIDVRFRCDDGHEMGGVLTMSGGHDERKRPGLILVYEAFGLNAEMRRVARDLSDEGWVVLIPDLFDRGLRPICIAKAFRTVMNGAGEALDDLEAARRWLAARPEVDPERLGVVGFCIGGGFALLLAMSDRYRAAAPFYGPVPPVMPKSCPVVASYGAEDRRFAGAAERLEEKLTQLGVPHDVKLYPGAGHSFYTRAPGGIFGMIAPYVAPTAGYHEASAKDAHARVVAFFRTHLDGAAEGA